MDCGAALCPRSVPQTFVNIMITRVLVATLTIMVIYRTTSVAQTDSLTELTILRNATHLFTTYRFPDNRDTSENWSGYKMTHGRFPTLCTANFNGDGHPDIAFLLASRRSDQVGVFCLVSNGNDTFQLVTLEQSKEPLASLGIQIAPPGQYTTANDKPTAFDLKIPGIDFFQFECCNSFFVWDLPQKSFIRIWMSD